MGNWTAIFPVLLMLLAMFYMNASEKSVNRAMEEQATSTNLLCKTPDGVDTS